MQVEEALCVLVAKVPADGAREHGMFSQGFEGPPASEVLHSKWLLGYKHCRSAAVSSSPPEECRCRLGPSGSILHYFASRI